MLVFSDSCTQKLTRLSFPFGLFQYIEYIEIHGALLQFQRVFQSFLSGVGKSSCFHECIEYLHLFLNRLPTHVLLLVLHGLCWLCIDLNTDKRNKYSHSFYIPCIHPYSQLSISGVDHSDKYSSHIIRHKHTHIFEESIFRHWPFIRKQWFDSICQ